MTSTVNAQYSGVQNLADIWDGLAYSNCASGRKRYHSRRYCCYNCRKLLKAGSASRGPNKKLSGGDPVATNVPSGVPSPPTGPSALPSTAVSPPSPVSFKESVRSSFDDYRLLEFSDEDVHFLKEKISQFFYAFLE